MGAGLSVIAWGSNHLGYEGEVWRKQHRFPFCLLLSFLPLAASAEPPCGRKTPVCRPRPAKRLQAVTGITAPTRRNRPNAGTCVATQRSRQQRQTAPTRRPLRQSRLPRRSPHQMRPVANRLHASRIKRHAPEQNRHKAARRPPRQLVHRIRRRRVTRPRARRPMLRRPRRRSAVRRHGPNRSPKVRPPATASLGQNRRPRRPAHRPKRRRRIPRSRRRPSRRQAASMPPVQVKRPLRTPVRSRRRRIATCRGAPSWRSPSPWRLSAF